MIQMKNWWRSLPSLQAKPALTPPNLSALLPLLPLKKNYYDAGISYYWWWQWWWWWYACAGLWHPIVANERVGEHQKLSSDETWVQSFWCNIIHHNMIGLLQLTQSNISIWHCNSFRPVGGVREGLRVPNHPRLEHCTMCVVAKTVFFNCLTHTQTHQSRQRCFLPPQNSSHGKYSHPERWNEKCIIIVQEMFKKCSRNGYQKSPIIILFPIFTNQIFWNNRRTLEGRGIFLIFRQRRFKYLFYFPREFCHIYKSFHLEM